MSSKLKLSVFAPVAALALALGFSILIDGRFVSPAVAQDAAAQPALPDMALGKADAPVTIIEYSSLSCPHCAHFHSDVLPELKKQFIDTGKVRYVQREFPLNDAGFAGSVLARCLDSSRFFAFNDLLFKKMDDWAFKQDALTPLKLYAKQAGLNDAEFNKCLADEDLQKKILAVRGLGEKQGVRGTPTFFINGKKFDGAPTIEAFAEAMKPYLGTQ
ncbi:DSBA oxidoreductase [Rhodomicrobium vannielii ATCC 17100]|uniref:DSBA oxidoreductase n=1 Tax=Rhodomicrobium vannielii (strain ATCC 17100 / DSM 162 / LMG 4299 / NCIMB 10020 / ATH 3.1.1) TaxID=648757 RepID=E3I0B4_RHOVT|nr:DsbA family protein [Rhodomicrobium vannielii]ADP72232.1 DSBA oxidoreductase [Rhodomicrobium vannielii ATCC 17100]